ncbi:MAG: hypothetical protein FWG93_06480 [Oscillospiraceae bacterium]|nr:hypothetical protein [Oscillospiraceae bacterium]
MNWTTILIMMAGAAATSYFMFQDYRNGKVSKKLFTTVFILDLIIIAGGVFSLSFSWL